MKQMLSILFFFISMPVLSDTAWKCTAEVDDKVRPLQSTGVGYKFPIDESQSTFAINFKTNVIEIIYQISSLKSKNQSAQILNCELEGNNCSGRSSTIYNGQAIQRKLSNAVNSRATIVKDGSKEVFKYLKTSKDLEISFLQDTFFSNLTYRCNR